MDCIGERLDECCLNAQVSLALNADRRHRPTRDIGRVNVLPLLHCISSTPVSLLIYVSASGIDRFKRENASIESNKDL